MRIIYNTSNGGWGGGIYLTDVTANMVNLTGGSITNNKATNGGGIHASKNTKVNISGSPIVLDNLSVNNNPNNLNLADNAVISVIGDIESSASIGVKKSSGTGKLTESENTVTFYISSNSFEKMFKGKTLIIRLQKDL